MKKYYDYMTTTPVGVIAEMAILYESNGEKFAVTMCDYFTHIEECEKYKKIGYVYV